MHEFQIKRYRRSKHIRISVDLKGKVRVTAPLYVSMRSVQAFVKEKQSWIERAIQDMSLVQKPTFAGETYAYHTCRARARKVITDRVKRFAVLHGFAYNRIAIKNTSSRWGSCSVDRNLNFNYKLLFLPDHLRDYIVVHELCHLRVLNHSPQFWKEVETILPDYLLCERELKQYYL